MFPLHRVLKTLSLFRPRRATPRPTTRLELRPLEDRCVLANASGLVIGQAFIDFNGNGAFNAGEPRLPGVNVTLTGTSNQGVRVQVRATTDSTGAYRILNVQPGTYRVNVDPLANFTNVQTNTTTFVVGGGQTVRRNITSDGLAPSAISLRQFLASSTNNDLPFTTPGRGIAAASSRENNRPSVRTTTAANALRMITAAKNDPDRFVDLAGVFNDFDTANTTVQFVIAPATTNGTPQVINVELFDRQAPQTVANFLNYVTSDRYDNTIFHRLDNDFVLQGGGFRFNRTANGQTQLPAVTTDPPVTNEFGRSNTLGTIAMAKLDGNPNSATSQFFFNLANNTSLDTMNGGFTVFGRIAGERDQSVLNTLSAIAVQDRSGGNTSSPFREVPLRNYTGTNFPTDATANNFVRITDVRLVKRVELLTYELLNNSNQSLVTASVQNNRLKLDYAANATGTAVLTVRATDAFGASVETTIRVTVNNTAPTATVALNTMAPQTNDTLTATATAADPNGDTVRLTYVWKVDGTTVKTTSNTTSLTDTLDLSQPGNGDRGQVVTVEVTPSDGAVTGTAVTANATVANTVPTAGAVTLTPPVPAVGDTVTATVASVADVDGQTVTLTYVWRVDGTVVKTTTATASLTDTLNLAEVGNGQRGQVVTVQVTPNDGVADGTAVTATANVANQAPVAGTLADQTFSGPGALNFDVTGGFTDPDADTLTFTATLNDAASTALPTWLQLNSAGMLTGNPATGDAATLQIRVTARDPFNLSTTATFQLTVSNTPDALNDVPVVNTVGLAPADPTVSTTLTATATVTDPDSAMVNLTYVWTLDGVTVKTTTATTTLTDTLDLTTVPGVAAGGVIVVTVTPSDGTATGAGVTATTTVV